MAGTPLPTSEHFATITDYIRVYSGELAFLPITENSNHPLYRYYVPDFAPPVKPDLDGLNARERIRVTNEYNRTVMRYMLARDKRAQHAEAELQQFNAEIAPVLAQPANRPVTDIWGGVARTRTMFQERTTFHNPHDDYDFLLVITDANHTASTAEVFRLPPTVHLYLVYNAMSISDFGGYNFHQFESIEAAIRALIARAERGGVTR